MLVAKKGDLVEFRDGHCQKITKVDQDVDDYIVWLATRFPNDPAWVLHGDLIWLTEDNRWYHAE